MRLYKKQDLQDALYEALLENPNEQEFVKKFITGLNGILAGNPAYYRYVGPYWWAIKNMMLSYDLPGIDDFIDLEWLDAGKIGLNSDALICIAAWAMQESRIEGAELPTNSVMLENDDGEVNECVVIDPFLESLVKNPRQ